MKAVNLALASKLSTADQTSLLAFCEVRNKLAHANFVELAEKLKMKPLDRQTDPKTRALIPLQPGEVYRSVSAADFAGGLEAFGREAERLKSVLNAIIQQL